MTSASRADSPRERILEAAKTEFALHGIAGARVDQIAKSARTSKERVYAYFHSKTELYRIVATQEMEAIAAATRLDPTDLPGYAGRVHDYFTAHRDNLRLMRWGQLELLGNSSDEVVDAMTARKTEQIRRAQLDGHLDPDWDPLDILTFVSQLATAWADQAPPGRPLNETPDEASAGVAQAAFLSARRAAIVAAVEKLFPAAQS
ncbi:TetR/AcrR family transcriptional regulator [Sinosporangium siamense]|nr:TetR family transcriptional regulator [Sinosporangium siamense]